ncbi:helix-turn-helix domain-containing protein [Oryzomicrobium sp.]|uniref:helix-turn-helix domain-containing protein n=1 Tax=Oryzomicrobium sp. TaxID=1911578 RepID=UPI0025E15F08|nr:helix-turn-helix domain-containing protein [Oryzomicrobium sp.]MCE1242542.1 DUF4115 domain-containing protein [Oryzomicrobium sp.]
MNSVTEAILPIDNETAAAPQQSVGQYLRAAREQRGVSVGEVASLLKLSVRQVEAIEADDWQRLPGQTFARGFLRNYARLLQLDGDMLLAHLEASLAPEPVKIELARTASGELPRPGSARRRDMVVALGAAGMVVVALGIYFLLPDNFWEDTVEPLLVSTPAPAVEEKAPEAEPQPEPPQAAAPAVPADAVAGDVNAAAVSAAPATAETPAAAPAPISASAPAAPVADKPAAAVAAPPAAQPAPAPVPAAQGAITPPGQGKLSFEFAKPSWVEVKDKSGQILLSQLQPAGSQKELAGTPPFSLVVGNASTVKVFYNGKPVALTPNGASDVARLSVQ